MDGSARLTADVRNGVRKAAKVDTRSTEFLKLVSPDSSIFMRINYHQMFNSIAAFLLPTFFLFLLPPKRCSIFLSPTLLFYLFAPFPPEGGVVSATK